MYVCMYVCMHVCMYVQTQGERTPRPLGSGIGVDDVTADEGDACDMCVVMPLGPTCGPDGRNHLSRCTAVQCASIPPVLLQEGPCQSQVTLSEPGSPSPQSQVTPSEPGSEPGNPFRARVPLPSEPGNPFRARVPLPSEPGTVPPLEPGTRYSPLPSEPGTVPSPQSQVQSPPLRARYSSFRARVPPGYIPITCAGCL